MSWWLWILLASATALAIKVLGYSVPARWLQNPTIVQMTSGMTVALLAALVAMNTFAAGTQWIIDARLGALVVAAVALWLRLPFLWVVVLGGACAAALRAL